MKLSEKGELSLLEAIRSKFPTRSKTVITGIGDDAAVLKPDLLVTTDMMLEGVHFDLRLITPFQLGFKLISVNVSDIYAMGGRPSFILLGIAVPGRTEDAFIQRFFDGVKAAIRLYKLSLVGGDVSSSKKDMVVSATLLGYAKKPIGRSGAKPGDRIYVTGNLGDSACGLELLKKINRQVEFDKPLNSPLRWNVMKPLLKKHLMPQAVNPGKFAKAATAMIDLSDGLFIDLTRLCIESNVGAKIYKSRIPVSNSMKTASAFLGLDPFRLAVAGGEDYELLFTAPPRKRPGAICIGEITESGMLVVDEYGAEKPFAPEGYQHFKLKK
jgi:thiamine-monophosphate kinase